MQEQNMKNKVVLITGGTNGIGEVAALELAKKGATVVVAARNPEKTERVLAEMRNDPEVTGKFDSIIANLASLDQVRHLAEEFLSRYDHLDVLINNAGAIFMQREESEDGYEKTFAVNHLSHFLLTNLLLDRIKASAPARIINVSSGAHVGARLDFSDLQSEDGYSNFKAYARSKLANIYFTFSLDKRLNGDGVTVNTMHPGFVATNFGRSNGGIYNFIFKLTQIFAKSPEEGAETIIYLASSPEVAGVSGKYFVDCKPKRASDAAYDEEAAKKLWQRSLELTGLD